MKKIDEETLIDALLEENPDSFTHLLYEQPEEDSLFDILELEEKHSNDIETLKFFARQGEETAIYELGACYMEGKGVEQDFAEACYWFEKSNDAASKMYIAHIHEREKENALALEYYEQAVKAREDAHNVRGLCYYALVGETLKVDVTKAEMYFYKMLECRLSEALKEEISSLSYMLALNYLLKENYEKAIHWLRFCLRYDRNDTEAREALKVAIARSEKAEEMKRTTEKLKEQKPEDNTGKTKKEGFFAALFGKKKR